MLANVVVMPILMHVVFVMAGKLIQTTAFKKVIAWDCPTLVFQMEL